MRGCGAVIHRIDINSATWEKGFATAAIRATRGRLGQLGRTSPYAGGVAGG
jgi:hypothetical protein